ncbi:hypothetical protein J7J23_00420 [bacterium]|nr:hypothetical protein [bacterium]
MNFILKSIIFLILAILIVLVVQIWVAPFLASNPFLGKFKIIKGLKREIVYNPVEKIIVQDSDVLEESIDKVKDVVVWISFNDAKDKDKSNICAISLTRDGLIVAFDASKLQFLKSSGFLNLNGKEVSFKVLSKDEKQGLVILKVDANNLKTTSFAQPDETFLGQQIFLLKKEENRGKVSFFVNKGIIRSIGNSLIETNILEDNSFNGCPAFNLEGDFLGFAEVKNFSNSNENNDSLGFGRVCLIPASKIRSFAGF